MLWVFRERTHREGGYCVRLFFRQSETGCRDDVDGVYTKLGE